MQILLLAIGLVSLALGAILYRRRQRRKRLPSNLIFRPQVDSSGNFMCFALGQRSPASLVRTDRT